MSFEYFVAKRYFGAKRKTGFISIITYGTPALLFGGDPDRGAAAFVVTEGDRNGNAVTYHLAPRLDDSLFVQLEVTFIGDEPQSMRLEDALGQQTALDFRNTVVNGKLDNDLFNFIAPDGVDVIRQSE